MIRPCFIIVDLEHSGSISTRKLVIETAKFNVITAYSGGEAIETLQKYLHVDGLVVDAGVKDVPCADLVRQLRGIRSDLPIIVIGRPGHWNCEGADHCLENFNPEELLKLLRSLEPSASAQISEREEQLKRSEQERL